MKNKKEQPAVAPAEKEEKIDVEIHHYFRVPARYAHLIKPSLEEWAAQWTTTPEE